MVTESTRNLTGQMSADNKAAYRRDTIMSSFMMFRNWIPKLITARHKGIKKSTVANDWQYGRTQAFISTWAHLGIWNIRRMSSIINGTEEGLKILDDLLEKKKEEHFQKTGQVLEITQEEFYDLMRRELERQVKELKVLASVMSLFLLVAAAKPPKDATDLEKNRYKYAFKMVDKFREELSFYYSPLSFESMTKGSIIPAVGVFSKGWKAITAIEEEARGHIMNNEDITKKAYPLKYFLNMVPIAGQAQNELLPYFYPEIAKDMGIRVVKESRR
jgi:hypothetical protein